MEALRQLFQALLCVLLEVRELCLGPTFLHRFLSLAQLDQNLLRHRLQGVEDSLPLGRHGFKGGLPLVVEGAVEIFHRHGARQITLIELQSVRKGLEIETVLFEVVLQIANRLDVGLHTLFLAVGHEDHTVRSLQDELATGVVEHLTRNGVEVKSGGEPADGSEIEGQEIEEEGAVGLGGEGNHLALRIRRRLAVDVLQVGGLTAQPGTVVHDLTVDFLGGVIDESHLPSPPLIAEQCVDVVVGDFGERRVRGSFEGIRTGFLGHGVEDLVELPCCALHPQTHQSQGRPFIEDHQKNRPLGDDGDVDVVALSLVEQHRELAFADELGEAVGGRHVTSGQRSQGRGVELLDFPLGCHLLPVLVDQEDRPGIGIVPQTLQHLFQHCNFCFVEYEIHAVTSSR